MLNKKGATMTITEKELNAILTTLERIEVHGFDNMNALMGVIQFLKQKQKESEEEDG